MPLKDYYAVLDVPRNASPEQIKRAYRRQARLYHPDLNKRTSDSHIKQINEAYNVLGDEARRMVYDLQLLEEQRRELILEALRRQQQRIHQERRMTWPEGIAGFFKELKKGMHDG